MIRLCAFALIVAGCSAEGLESNSLPGTWSLTTAADGARASYTFQPDGAMSFDGQTTAHVHLDGRYLAEGAQLSLAFNGRGSYVVPYNISGDKLTITDDPATVAVGEHLDVVYTRQ